MDKSGDLQISTDQAFYDQEPLASREQHEKWMREIEFYFSSYEKRLNQKLAGTDGVVAELGAGSCGLSVCLTRLSNVNQVYSLDISQARMSKMIGLSSEILDGNSSKIVPIASDFNERLPFEDASLDALLFDAALHHSRSMWNLLSECKRVLKKNGLLIAQRESYLSPLRAKKQLNNLMLSPEVAAAVSENMYLKEQYEYYLKVNGFNVNFQPVSRSSLKKMLRVLNGSMFCDGVLWCYK